MTRKGLAFGAGLALIGSGLGVAPASATDAVNVLLAPKTGTTYNSILQAGITLTDKWGNPVATSTTTEALTLSSAGSVQFNGVNGSIDKNFDKNGEVLVYARSVKDIAGPGTLTASLNANSKYSATSAAAATTLAVTEIADDVDGTVWDESAFANAISSVVNVLETAPAAAQKVNAGSFKGYVALYAKGYEGQRMSAKVGKDWVVVPSIVNNQENGTLFRAVEFVGAGVDISVRIYIDRVLVSTIPLLTK